MSIAEGQWSHGGSRLLIRCFTNNTNFVLLFVLQIIMAVQCPS